MSLLDPAVECKFLAIDVDGGALTLRIIMNGKDGPVALLLTDRTQKLQPRQIEFTNEQWHDLITKALSAWDEGQPS